MTIVQYTMQPGDTLWGLAQKYHTTVSDIASFNGLSQTVNIPIGQEIMIPLIDSGIPRWYIIKPGDSLYSIGQKYGLDLDDILEYNYIDNPDLIYPGQMLRLKK
ncbi:MAG: LysM peptidoglycan-binding domain-containing protein [Bacillota bacterium]|nr:LysM peptidoglycan-binding domain-containing protein [Bacillota bacterium]